MVLKNIQHLFHKELDTIYGKEEVDSLFFLCVSHYLNLARFQLALDIELTISKSETVMFYSVLEDLKKQKPIQYILGETEFYGLPFKVNEHVLIPRQETEELVALILQNIKKQKLNCKVLKVLDIGTGSGCLAICLAMHLPNAEVFALDISDEALNVAKQNARLNNIKITFLKLDILNESSWDLEFKDLQFDIVVSNPPYVRELEKAEIQPNVLDNEPHLALFVEDNNPLVFYKAITDFAVDNLKSKGELYFEINQYLGPETRALLTEANFENVELVKDLNGNDRMLNGTKK